MIPEDGTVDVLREAAFQACLPREGECWRYCWSGVTMEFVVTQVNNVFNDVVADRIVQGMSHQGWVKHLAEGSIFQ